LIFSKTFLSNIFITRKVERELIKNIRKSSCQRAVFLVRFTRNLNFPVTAVRKIFKYQVSWNSVHAYRGTDRHDEANSRFSQFDASIKEPFYVRFNQTQSVNNTISNFHGNSPVSSRSKPNGRKAKE
jgi:hypothetical protein